MTIQNIRLAAIVASVGVLLLIPAVAMQLTDEVKWGPFDFLVAGFLLLATGLMCEMALRFITTWPYRIAACAALLIGLFLVWAELAVGIFGTPFAGS